LGVCVLLLYVLEDVLLGVFGDVDVAVFVLGVPCLDKSLALGGVGWIGDFVFVLFGSFRKLPVFRPDF
jgi:hypothetical protein